MDFFGQQDAARARTRWLVAFFVAAVACIIAGTYLVVLGAFFYMDLQGEEGVWNLAAFWRPGVLVGVSAATLAVIGGGSLYKIASLSEGGESVARLLGGRPLEPSTRDPHERKLLNVVEEMALASGVPVPRVFLLEKEEAINAFAAGYSPDSAVIGVTRGCMTRLDRDELQGVMAHEFSHILNGDMRLNIKLMGVLHGILLIALIGYWVLRSQRFSGRRKGGGQVVIIGLALLVLGSAGLFFGRLIKAAVSRQREYLADASAVQFTRHPQGIAGALAKIGGLKAGSELETPKAEEASHMYFSDGISRFLSLFATHPPLEMRIRRIDPHMAQQLEREGWSAVARPASPAEETGAMAAAPMGSSGVRESATEPPPHTPPPLTPETAASRVGSLDAAHLAYARRLLDGLPDDLTAAAQEPASAEALLYLLLLDPDPDLRRRQRTRLQGRLEPQVEEALHALAEHRSGLAAEGRLPLLDLALPALHGLSGSQWDRIQGNVRRLVTADERVSLFEYTLQHVLERHLRPRARRGDEERGRRLRLSGVGEEAAVLVSALARAGQPSGEAAEEAFATAARELGAAGRGARLLDPSDCGLRQVDRALERLARLDGNGKRGIIRAATASVLHDGQITLEEGELLRAVAEALRCPMPPFIPGMEI